MKSTFAPFARPLYVMSKPIGSDCNLACDYCYYFGGLICDHIDENGKCLGFRRYKIIDKIKYKYTQHKINKIVKKYLTNNPSSLIIQIETNKKHH